MLDLKLCLVTDTRLCGKRGVLATVAAAVAGGVTAVQVRDPLASGRQLFELAMSVRTQLLGTGVPLIVDDRLDIALAVGADGVHLGQEDLPPPAARGVAGPDLVIGWSVATLAQLDLVPRFPAGTVDYLGVGPVYDTATKPDAGPGMGLAGLRAVCLTAALPCVAIGGIDDSNAADVASCGVAGLAVVSAICAAPDPEAAARRIRQAAGG
jgi:thiamine-phosphate pyrophosphorylase